MTTSERALAYNIQRLTAQWFLGLITAKEWGEEVLTLSSVGFADMSTSKLKAIAAWAPRKGAA